MGVWTNPSPLSIVSALIEDTLQKTLQLPSDPFALPHRLTRRSATRRKARLLFLSKSQSWSPLTVMYAACVKSQV